MSTIQHRMTSPGIDYLAAAAAFIVAVLDLFLILGSHIKHDVLDWFVHNVALNSCAILALLVLRQRLRNTATGRSLPEALLGLAIIHAGYGLLATVHLVGHYDLRFSQTPLAGGAVALYLIGAALCAFIALQVLRSGLIGYAGLTAFATLAALGAALRIVNTDATITVATTLSGIAYGVLGMVFVRIGRAAVADDSDATPRNKGIPKFAAIVIGLAAFSSMTVAYSQFDRGPLMFLAVFLLAPQFGILDSMGAEEAPVFLFALALVTLPFLLLPTGVRLIAGKPRQLWITIALQILFLLVYAVMGAVAVISGIQG